MSNPRASLIRSNVSLLRRDSVFTVNSLYIPMLVRGLAVILLVFIIPLEFIIRGLLSDNENNMIHSIQSHRTTAQDDFFRTVSATADHAILVILMPFLFNTTDPVVTFKIGIVSCHSLYLYSLISVIFTEARPYWVHSDLKGINCENGYGAPCEQILFGMVFYFYVIIELFEKQKHIIRGILYFMISLWLCLIGYAEMYLGENFPHQIILTVFLGYIYLTVALSLDLVLSELALISSFYDNKNRKTKVYWFITSVIMLLVMLTISSNISTNNSIDIIWIKNAYTQCKFSEDVSGSYSFNQSSWIFYNLGAVYGSMESSQRLALGWWKNNYWLRGLRSVISSGIAYAIYYGFSKIETNDNTSAYTFNYALPAFICAFFTFGVMPLVFDKIGMNYKQSTLASFASGISLNIIEN